MEKVGQEEQKENGRNDARHNCKLVPQGKGHPVHRDSKASRQRTEAVRDSEEAVHPAFLTCTWGQSPSGETNSIRPLVIATGCDYAHRF